MKNLISSLIAGVLFIGTGYCQSNTLKEDAVPEGVRKSCQEKFPTAKKIEWKLKTDKNYEAEFKLNGPELAVKFSPDGKWLETESDIKEAQLPAPVKSAIDKDFAGYKIIETQSVEAAGSKELDYEIHVKKEKETVKVQYTPEGKQLNKSSKMEK